MYSFLFLFAQLGMAATHLAVPARPRIGAVTPENRRISSRNVETPVWESSPARNYFEHARLPALRDLKTRANSTPALKCNNHV
jgi:hypothetical protein